MLSEPEGDRVQKPVADEGGSGRLGILLLVHV